MTMLNPTITLSRLSVIKDGYEVLDVKFHSGVNIISGHNSSGKTTVLDFIAYTLGAENIPWKQEALLCDTSIAEVALNGKAITVRRDVNEKPLNPLHIYWGNIEEAARAPLSAWETFPFKRSAHKISFTQSILLAMGLSEAQGDGASNLTMHQFLRVLYADQPSLHSPIFRVDTFDNALTRETVGNYLCGIYDDNLYSAQLERRGLEKELTSLSTELRSIFAVFARSQQDFSLEFFDEQIKNLEHDRDALRAELLRLKSERTVRQPEMKGAGKDALRAELDKAKSALIGATDDLARAELEIADTDQFITEIRERLANIEDSHVTRNYFGSLTFTFCPSCLAQVNAPESGASVCSLCKTPSADGIGDGQLLRMKNELRIQLKESEALVSESRLVALKIRTELPSLKQDLARLEATYASSTAVWSSELEIAVEAAARSLGQLEQRIQGLYESQKLGLVIKELQARRDAVSARFVDVDSTIEKLEFSQEERKRKISLEIASTLGSLLRRDLDRQAEFQSPDKIEFSFSDNQISVNGATKFSESSTVVLRHLFHVALLSASTRVPVMRFPRFLILDGIEDGGLEIERAHLLQEIIVSECERFECEYQLIFASSQIAPSLNSDAYVVGRTFSESSRSLAIG